MERTPSKFSLVGKDILTEAKLFLKWLFFSLFGVVFALFYLLCVGNNF